MGGRSEIASQTVRPLLGAPSLLEVGEYVQPSTLTWSRGSIHSDYGLKNPRYKKKMAKNNKISHFPDVFLLFREIFSPILETLRRKAGDWLREAGECLSGGGRQDNQPLPVLSNAVVYGLKDLES